MRCAIPLPDLAAPPPVVAPPPPDPALLDAIREAAEAEGHARGFAEGLTEGARRQRDAQEAAIAASLGLVAAAMEEAGARGAEAADRAAEALARTVFAALDAALPGLAARHGPEMAATLAAALRPALADRPEARLLVAPEQAEAVAARLPAGLVVEGDALLAPGDARLEWRDGAQILSLEERRAAIRAALAATGLWNGDDA